MSQYNMGLRSFQAGEDLIAFRRVKIESGSVTDPPEVVYADVGEQAIGTVVKDVEDGKKVTVLLENVSGTRKNVAAGAFARGATLYAADDGKVDDVSSGSAIGIAIELATANGDIKEIASYAVLSTTAATVSTADVGGFTSAATAEAQLQELYQHVLSIQQTLPLPLNNFRETTNFDVGAIAVNGGILASDTTPILEGVDGATDGCQRLNWVASNSDQIVTQIVLPVNLDVSKDLVLHVRIASGGTTDAVGFTVDTFFNEGDTKVVDTTTTNQTVVYTEKIATIAAADIPVGAQTITVGLTPVAHTTDKLYLTAAWFEWAPIILTS